MHLYGIPQLVAGVRAARADTLVTAADIPESQYHFRPTPESRSVAETLVHIAWLSSFDRHVHEEARVDSLDGFDFGAAIERSAAEERRPRSKADIVDLLRTDGDRRVRWVEQLPEALLAEQVRMPGGGSMSRFELLLKTREHEVHHRAQLTVLQRLLGLVPLATRNRAASRDAAEPALSRSA